MRIIALVFLFFPLFSMSPSTSHLVPPLEIVISDELGVVERMPVGPQSLEREMSLWMMKEMLQRNKELQEQLAATKKKWYVITAGVVTTVIPLVIVVVELWNLTQDCD